MKIQRIKIQNFGPFYGDHEIDFLNQGDGVHVIRGDNGQGKTSIQRAILWCLYGKVTDRQGENIKPTSLLNWTACKEDKYQFGVVINFEHDGEKWSVSRKMTASQHTDKKYEAGMKIHVVRNDEPQPNPEHEIRRVLPEDVSRFFFFDGEMLRDYEELLDQNSRSMGVLRDSIEHVLGIPYLRTARDDLYEVRRKIENERSKLIRRFGGKDYDDLVEQFQTVSDRIDIEKKEIKTLEKQMDQLDREISDRKHKMTDIQAVAKLAEERISHEKTIEVLEGKRNLKNEELVTLTSQFYKTILARIAENIIAQLQAKHESSMSKYNEKQQLIGRAKEIEKAIGDEKCRLCGTTLDSKVIKRMRADLDDINVHIQDLTEIPEPNLEYDNHKNRLRQMLTQKIDREKFKEIENSIYRIDYDLATERSIVNGIREKLTGVDDEEPRRIANEIEKMNRELGRLTEVKKTQEKQMLEDLGEKAELDKKIQSIDRAELRTLGKRIEVSTMIAEVFESAIAVYRNERRADVELKATEIFREIRTKPSFSRLSINDQFGLNIITQDETTLDRAEWRSSGEQQIVALSLIGALNRCAQVKAPVFMDTPFGRLDSKHGERVLRFLPKLADQVVLLVTDREFHKGDEKYLEGRIKSDFTVVHKGQRQGSRVIATTGRGD